MMGHQLREGLDAIHVTIVTIDFLVYMIMCVLCEVASYPFTYGFAVYCNRYVDPTLGFACV